MKLPRTRVEDLSSPISPDFSVGPESIFDDDSSSLAGIVRPPAWEKRNNPKSRNCFQAAIDEDLLLEKQLETLIKFRDIQDQGHWSRIHKMHFDWWMFPIDVRESCLGFFSY
jgi:hypothetical protein